MGSSAQVVRTNTTGDAPADLPSVTTSDPTDPAAFARLPSAPPGRGRIHPDAGSDDTGHRSPEFLLQFARLVIEGVADELPRISVFLSALSARRLQRRRSSPSAAWPYRFVFRQ